MVRPLGRSLTPSLVGSLFSYLSTALSYCLSPFVLCLSLLVALPLIRFSAVVSCVIVLSSERLMMLLTFCSIDVGTPFLFLSLMEFSILKGHKVLEMFRGEHATCNRCLARWNKWADNNPEKVRELSRRWVRA